jgi:predicted ABC-type ATPase
VAIARGWLEENGFKDEAQGNAVQVVQAMQDHYPDGYEFFLSINDMHKEDFRRNYMQNGEYVPEREDLHNAIRASYLRTGQVPTEGKPTAMFLAGGSGAGKSSILGKQTPDGKFEGGQDIGAPEHAVYINPDDIKEILPETEKMKEADDPRWAALSHEESSDIAARLRKDAEQAHFPMVVDGTGDAAPGKFLGKIQDAEKAGYDTKVIFVDIPTDEAIRRADKRALETGRKISAEQIRTIHKNVTARHKEWRDQVDNWEVWANDDPEHGGRRLIAKRENGGKIDVIDKGRYDQMLEKAA